MNQDTLTVGETERAYIAAHQALEAEGVRDERFRGIAQSPAEAAMQKYILTEARFIDEVLHKQFPEWLIRLANQRQALALGRFATVLMAFYMKAKGIDIERSTHRGMHGGIAAEKGFRAGKQFTTIDAITTRVMKRGKVLAEKRIDVGIIEN